MTENCLHKCGLPCSVFTDDTDPFPLGKYQILDIKKWLLAANEALLEGKYLLLGTFPEGELEVGHRWYVWLLNDFYFFQSSLATLGEARAGSGTESVDESLFALHHSLLFVVDFPLFLGEFSLLIDRIGIVSVVYLERVSWDDLVDDITGFVEKLAIM